MVVTRKAKKKALEDASKLVQKYKNEFSKGTSTGMRMREGSFGGRACVGRGP